MNIGSNKMKSDHRKSHMELSRETTLVNTGETISSISGAKKSAMQYQNGRHSTGATKQKIDIFESMEMNSKFENHGRALKERNQVGSRQEFRNLTVPKSRPDKSKPIKETKTKHSHHAYDTMTRKSSNSSGSQTSTPTTLTPSIPKQKSHHHIKTEHTERVRRLSIDHTHQMRQSIDPSQFKSYAELQEAMHILSLTHQPANSRKPIQSRKMATINQDDESDTEPLANVLARQMGQEQCNYFTVPLQSKKASYPPLMEINFSPISKDELINQKLVVVANDNQSVETVIQDDDEIPLAYLPKLKH